MQWWTSMTCWPDKTGLRRTFSSNKCSNFRPLKTSSWPISAESILVSSSLRWLLLTSNTECPSCFQYQQPHFSSRSRSPPNSLTKDLSFIWCQVCSTNIWTQIQLSIRDLPSKVGLKIHLSPRWSKTSTKNSWQVLQFLNKLVAHLFSSNSNKCNQVPPLPSNQTNHNKSILRRRKDTLAKSLILSNLAWRQLKRSCQSALRMNWWSTWVWKTRERNCTWMTQKSKVLDKFWLVWLRNSTTKIKRISQKESNSTRCLTSMMNCTNSMSWCKTRTISWRYNTTVSQHQWTSRLSSVCSIRRQDRLRMVQRKSTRLS